MIMKEGYTTKQANQHIQKEQKKVNTQYKGEIHFSAPTGWINDPNGFIFFKGEYHLFYQYYPYGTQHGPMHWGHAKSKDLISWEHLPVALAPDETYDIGGCFSGSAIEKDGKLYLMYTGHLPAKNERDTRQFQCIAVSEDGIHFEKIAQNPVLTEKDLPANASVQDFRDPKVFENQGVYYCVIGSKTNQGNGQVLLYSSNNLVDWTFKSILLKGHIGQGIVWECPDLFELDGKDVLLFSPIQMEQSGNDFHNLSSAVAVIGQVNWETGKFHTESIQEIDHGLDFYAPQTTFNGKDRIMIAWMQMWERNIPTDTEKHGWAGSMTLPRVLHVKENKLVQQSVLNEQSADCFEPIFKLKGKCIKDTNLSNEMTEPYSYQIKLTINVERAEQITLSLHSNEEEDVSLDWLSDVNEVRFNREHSGHKIVGAEKEELHERKVNVALKEGCLMIEMVVDKSSVEFFIQNGEETITSTVYPSSPYEVINLSSKGKSVIHSLEMNKLIV